MYSYYRFTAVVPIICLSIKLHNTNFLESVGLSKAVMQVESVALQSYCYAVIMTMSKFLLERQRHVVDSSCLVLYPSSICELAVYREYSSSLTVSISCRSYCLLQCQSKL